MMIETYPLTRLNATELQRIASGYSSDGKYIVIHKESKNQVSFDLQFKLLDKPYVKQHADYDSETCQRYNRILDNGYSFGAYDNDLLIGLIIAEPRLWNGSVWVWEFHVAETHRHLGIGKRLMTHVAEKAKAEDFRTIVCETQNTNATAIKIYHQLGFRVEGVDISYYSNDDYPDGEMAVFMKRRLK